MTNLPFIAERPQDASRANSQRRLLLPALAACALCLSLWSCSETSTTPADQGTREAGPHADGPALERSLTDLRLVVEKKGLPSDAPPSPDGKPDSKPAGAITHGDQLTKAHVGPAAIGLDPSKCTVTPGSVYTSKPSWVTRTVAAGGEVIDGFQVPAGAWVVEGCTFTGAFQIYGNEGTGTAFKGLVLRGCKLRFSETVVPGIYVREEANAPIWLLHSDLGSPDPAKGHMVPLANIDGGTSAGSYVYRNYISRVATGLQINADNGHLIENYIEDLVLYDPSLHLNGFTTNGGIKGIELLRNHIVVQSTDSAGHQITQTDAISFFQDFGDFQGTAPGGYQVKDNLLGGGGYALYAGMNSGKPATSVKNMIVTGNKFTTVGTWPKSGYWGPVAAEPVWGQYGNLFSGNTWADGANAGKGL